MQNEVCSEPGGNDYREVMEGVELSMHDIMIQETGQCPWCGAED